jgi:hypothetical protein
MIAIGLPGPHGAQDEDSLNREQDGGGEDNDLATEAITSIAERLVRDGPSTIRLVRLLARGIEDMAQAAMKRDHHALEEAAADACDALRGLID